MIAYAVHHPSCPAGRTAGAPCICPDPTRRPALRSPRRAVNAVAEAVAFAAMLGFMGGVPLYLLWRFYA